MLTFLVLRLADQKKISLSEKLAIPERATREKDPKAAGFSSGETLPLGILLQWIALTNAPDACIAVSDYLRGISGRPTVPRLRRIAANIPLGQNAVMNLTGRNLSAEQADQHFTMEDLVKLGELFLICLCTR